MFGDIPLRDTRTAKEEILSILRNPGNLEIHCTVERDLSKPYKRIVSFNQMTGSLCDIDNKIHSFQDIRAIWFYNGNTFGKIIA